MNLDTTFGRHLLLPHPSSEPGAQADLVHDLSVTIARLSADRLKLTYRFSGDLEALRLPEPRSAARTDGLWRHTCFEAFIGHSGAGDYWEYNFSPSGAWAAYHFSGYREGMAPLLKGAPPDIVRNMGGETIELAVSLDLSWLMKSFCGAGTASRSRGGDRRQSAGAVILGAQTSRGETRFPPRRQLCRRARLNVSGRLRT